MSFVELYVDAPTEEIIEFLKNGLLWKYMKAKFTLHYSHLTPSLREYCSVAPINKHSLYARRSQDTEGITGPPSDVTRMLS